MKNLTDWKGLTTTDLADSIINLNLELLYLPSVKLCSPVSDQKNVSVVGYAKTVKIVLFDDDVDNPGLTASDFVDVSDSDEILVISSPNEAVNAVFGGLLATRSKRVGIKAAVIDGFCRDLDELDELKFPVFCKGTSCLGASKMTKVSNINVPVRLGSESIDIHPGDLVMGDINGVIFVRRKDMEPIRIKALELKKQDEGCLQDLRNGVTLKESLKRNRH